MAYFQTASAQVASSRDVSSHAVSPEGQPKTPDPKAKSMAQGVAARTFLIAFVVTATGLCLLLLLAYWFFVIRRRKLRRQTQKNDDEEKNLNGGTTPSLALDRDPVLALALGPLATNTRLDTAVEAEAQTQPSRSAPRTATIVPRDTQVRLPRPVATNVHRGTEVNVQVPTPHRRSARGTATFTDHTNQPRPLLLAQRYPNVAGEASAPSHPSTCRTPTLAPDADCWVRPLRLRATDATVAGEASEPSRHQPIRPPPATVPNAGGRARAPTPPRPTTMDATVAGVAGAASTPFRPVRPPPQNPGPRLSLWPTTLEAERTRAENLARARRTVSAHPRNSTDRVYAGILADPLERRRTWSSPTPPDREDAGWPLSPTAAAAAAVARAPPSPRPSSPEPPWPPSRRDGYYGS